MTTTPKTLVVALLVAAGLLVGCGDDDDSPEAAYCEQVDELEQSLADLRNLDVVAQGTDELRARVDEVRTNLSEVRAAAPDAAPEAADAFDTAFSSLQSAVEALGDGELTAATARDAIAAIGATATAAQDYFAALDEACS